MGMDVYGIKPKQNTNPTDAEKYPLYSIIQQMEWSDGMDMLDSMNEDDTKQYWKEYNDYEDANPGTYFRNNVWWWRPLWEYTCHECQDFMSDDDMQHGAYNDGHKYSATKAKKMAKRLQDAIDKGRVKKYEKEWTLDQEKLSESDDKETKFLSNYPFDEANVKRFVAFLKECGGFQIC